MIDVSTIAAIIFLLVFFTMIIVLCLNIKINKYIFLLMCVIGAVCMFMIDWDYMLDETVYGEVLECKHAVIKYELVDTSIMSTQETFYLNQEKEVLLCEVSYE